MANRKLTDKQREILEYLKECILQKGYPPAVREICEAVHLKSTSSVHAHLESLEEKGKEIEPDIQVRIPTEPMAATASLPSRPTHAISVRLYAIWINDVAMIGIARLNS